MSTELETEIFDLHTRIAEIAKGAPGAAALLGCGRRAASYGDLLQQMEQTAEWLRGKGIGRGDRVAVVMPNGPEMASLFLGVACVATCAPLNAAYRANEFEFYLSDLRPRLLIVDAGLETAARGMAAAMGIAMAELRRDEAGEAGRCVLDGGDGVGGARVEYARAEDVALVLHTSGTTSRPKIVPLTQENLCVSAGNIAESLGLTAEDRCLNIMPLFHVHGLVGAVLSSLAAGASVVCTPGYNAAEFFGWLAEFGPSWYTGVPTMHHGIAARAEANRAVIAAHRLRLIRSCSAALAPQLMARLEAVFGVPVLEAYGMTEAAHQMASNGLPPRARKPGSVGRATGVDVAVMNEAGALLPAGAEGEVVIRGRNVTRGYENNPEANERSFVGGWFRTGDQGRLDEDGDLFLTGRIKELIVRGGEKIAPREIDEALLAHPAVEQALGFALPDEVLGEKVAAAVVLKAGAAATELELQEHAAARLADFKVPEKIVFVAELAKGPTGKPQRIGLAEKLGLDKASAKGRGAAYCAARSESERRLEAMWREVLQLERAGVHDNFFDAGGDSILASQLMVRIRKEFGVELSTPRLFQLPTIAQQAEFIDGQAGGKGSSLTLPQVSRVGGVELSSAQRRMWFLEQLEPGTAVYNRPFAYRLKGRLDGGRLQESVNALVERHEILRTVYSARDGEVRGVVGEAYAVAVEWTDLSEMGGAEREAAALEWMRRESARPFNLEKDRMLRCAVARLAAEEHILLLGMHHTACDASTEPVLMRELGQAYGRKLPSGTCAQYADYAAWQLEREAKARGEGLQWWKTRLAEVDGSCEIPCDFQRPRVSGHAGGAVPIELDCATVERMKQAARSSSTTLFTVLLAAFNALLYRYTGAEDLVVGVPVAVRNHPAAERMVGLFINTLALRTSAAGDPGFREFLVRTRETVAEALAHEEAPFDAVVDGLRRERGGALAPLFQVLLEYRNIEKPHLEMAGLLAERIEFDRGVTPTPFDLTLDMEPSGGGVLGWCYYNAGLFERETVERLVRHYQTLLGHAVEAEDLRLSELRLETAEEQARALAWGEKRPYPDVCVHELFEQQAARTPDAAALVTEQGSLSYDELNRRANRLAHRLLELGVRPDGRVAICAERGLEMVVALLATLKSGGAYVPLDPDYPAERLRYMVEDSAPTVLLAESKLRERFAGVDAAVVDLTGGAEWREQPESNLERGGLGLTPRHLAYVLYTSGSTGEPKGVMVEHASVVNRMTWMQDAYHLGAQDAVLQKTPFGFDVSVWEFFWPLLAGARLVMARPGGHRDPEYLAAAMESNGITTVHFVPSMLQAFVERGDERASSTVARVICSGEALMGTHLRRFQERFPQAQLHNLYGPTETTVDVTAWTWNRKSNLDAPPARTPIGRPIANTWIYILDGHGQVAPVGVAGEICVGGVGVARGYLNRPELTAGCFVADPFVRGAGARIYRTGDRGRWLADGNIEFLGRSDFQVKIRGFRVELGEIEARLAEFAGVREAAVMAHEDAPGEQRLIAYFTGSGDGEALTAEQLRAHLAERLPQEMVPAAFVHLPAMPLTVNGKLNRKALPLPGLEAYPRRGYEPPRGIVETELAAIWAEVLRMERVGRHDDFFALGGHSLSAMQVVARIRRVFGLEIRVSCVFQTPVLEELAKRIEDQWQPEHSEEDLLRILNELEAMPEAGRE